MHVKSQPNRDTSEGSVYVFKKLDKRKLTEEREGGRAGRVVPRSPT